GSVALAVAAAALGSARKGERDRMALLDAAILTAAVGVVAWNWVAEPHLGSVALTATLVDVLVIGLSLRLVLSRDGRDLSTVAFASGAALLVTMDLLSTGVNVTAAPQPGSAAAGACLLSFLLIGAAALLPSDVPAINGGIAMAMGRTRLLVVLAAVFVPEA